MTHFVPILLQVFNEPFTLCRFSGTVEPLEDYEFSASHGDVVLRTCDDVGVVTGLRSWACLDGGTSELVQILPSGFLPSVSSDLRSTLQLTSSLKRRYFQRGLLRTHFSCTCLKGLQSSKQYLPFRADHVRLLVGLHNQPHGISK